MINRLLILLTFSLQVKSAYANQDWMNQMIASKDKGTLSHSISKSVDNEFFTQHTLVLFYSSTCPHCHQFAPVLKNWAESYQAGVLALSFDNESLPEFPNFKPATTEWVNAAFAGRSISYPALFVVNKQTQVLYPVALGAMTSTELNARMKSLVPKIKAYEHKGVNA